MCSAEKCCFFINMNFGSVLIGIVTFIISALMTIVSSIYLIVDRDLIQHDGSPILQIHRFLHPYLNDVSIDIILWISLFLGVLSMVSSVLLIVGIKKSKPGLVLTYFVFGIFSTIAGILGGLLFLLAQYWNTSLSMFIISLINIHFLVVVHTVYDSILRGKELSFSPHERLLEESIIE